MYALHVLLLKNPERLIHSAGVLGVVVLAAQIHILSSNWNQPMLGLHRFVTSRINNQLFECEYRDCDFSHKFVRATTPINGSKSILGRFHLFAELSRRVEVRPRPEHTSSQL